MVLIWDEDINELKKTENGRIKIMERMINFGLDKGETISLSKVKKYWNELHLFTPQRRLLELLIWGRYLSSPKNRKSSWPE